MPNICPHCKKKIVKFPLFVGEGKDRKFVWINLFKMDLQSIITIFLVLTLAFSYKIDTAKCDEVIREPCGFCKRSNCCSILNSYQPDRFVPSEEYIVDIPMNLSAT